MFTFSSVVFKRFLPITTNIFQRSFVTQVLELGIWTLLYGITFMVMPGKLSTNYYMCTGEDPRNDYYTTKKVKGDFHLRN